jgi:rhodanese-related sulfurtransferase
MATIATTEDVQRLQESGAVLLEVLPKTAYDLEHIPGARNVPLPDLDAEALEPFDRDQPIVVYCYDHECDLSARGAAILEQHGFAEVYDYAASKTAWLGAGLPAEGDQHERRAGDVVDRSVPTCGPGADVRSLGASREDDLVVVVDDHRVVLGGIRPSTVNGLSGVTALDAADPAPPSVRPSITVSELAGSMDKDGQDHVLVTTFSGELIGAVRRADLPTAP